MNASKKKTEIGFNHKKLREVKLAVKWTKILFFTLRHTYNGVLI